MTDTGKPAAKDDLSPWLVAERSSLDSLAIPIKLNKSLQFTAIEISASYIWCGSNRTNLYVFDRQSLKHVYLIPILSITDIDSVTQLAVYHTEQLCAVAVGCQVYTCSIQHGTTKNPQVVEALKGQTTITQIVWHRNSTKLYVGDNSGCIHVCSIMTYKMIARSTILCKLDSCIVQLDFRSHVLLAATLTKCTLYNTEKKTITDIGKKARNGYYGAALLPAVSEEASNTRDDPICYCARPGLRLWRADVEGKVLATLNFKQALAECPLSPIYGSMTERADDTAESPRVTTFSYLSNINDGYILSLSNNKIVVLDPITSTVLISTEIDPGIISCCVDRNSCYIVTSQGDIRCIELLPVTDYLETLLGPNTICKAVELALSYKTYLCKHGRLLGRIRELISTDSEQYQQFSDAFSAPATAHSTTAASTTAASTTAASTTASTTAANTTAASTTAANTTAASTTAANTTAASTTAASTTAASTTAANTTAASTTAASTTAANTTAASTTAANTTAASTTAASTTAANTTAPNQSFASNEVTSSQHCVSSGGGGSNNSSMLSQLEADNCSSICEPPTEGPVVVESTPVDSTPVNSIPVDSIPVISKPVDSTPVNSTPVDSIPVNSTPVDSTPVNSTPVDSTPVNSTPVDSTPVKSSPVDSTPVDSIPVGSLPVDSIPVGSLPVDSIPVDSIPVDSIPVDSIPVDSIHVDSTPVDSTPVDSTPVDTPAATVLRSKGESVVLRDGSASVPISCPSPKPLPQTNSDGPYAQSPTLTGTIAMSPTAVARGLLSRRDSTRSTASVDSMQCDLNHRRNSVTSLSSFDQSGDFSEDSSSWKTNSKGRKIKASTIKFPSTDKGEEDSSGDETTGHHNDSSSVPISRSSSGHQSLSRSRSSAIESSSPASTATSPGAVAEHVRDVKGHVIDGISKISSQALSLISTIKERTISQPVIEKLLSSTSKDDSSDGLRAPEDLCEDSDSRQIFYIGDEEINMSEEMPSALTPFLELSESTYSLLADPFHFLVNDEQTMKELSKWYQKLCQLSSQYTRTKGKSNTESKTLRCFTRVCPWKMSSDMTAQCKFLATLCVLRACSEALLDYTIIRESEASSQFLIPPASLEKCKGKNTFDESYDFSQLYSGEHESSASVTLADCVESPVSADNVQGQKTTPNATGDDKHLSSLAEVVLQSANFNSSAASTSSIANHNQSSPPVISPLADVKGYDVTQAEQTTECSSLTLLCQSMSTFWFLMNTRELCAHIEHLTVVSGEGDDHRKVWVAFINCLVGNTYDKLEWKSLFNVSLYTSTDVGKQLLKQNDKAGMWLIVYLLIRQQQAEEAVNIALGSHMQVPPIHVLYSLEIACQLDKLTQLTAQQHFSGYILSLIQQLEASARSRFIRDHMIQPELLSYWMESLEGCWRAGGIAHQLCKCGQPKVLTSDGLITTHNRQFTLSDAISLLEETLLHITQVQSTVLLIGGSSALLRLRKREGKREEVLKLFLLASDYTVLQHHTGGFKLTNEDCLYLLNQRTLLEPEEAGNVCCLWCREVYYRSEPLLSWDSIAELVMTQLGPEACMDVMLNASLPEQSVSHHFFSHCVKAHQSNLQSSQLVSDAIDGLERFLWSSELADKTCDSRMYQLMLTEAELNKVMRNGQTVSDSQHNQLLEMSNSVRESDSLRFIDDTEIHWGATVNLSDDCFHCGLTLSQSNMNVTVLQCGHCGHESCCRGAAACLKCLTVGKRS